MVQRVVIPEGILSIGNWSQQTALGFTALRRTCGAGDSKLTSLKGRARARVSAYPPLPSQFATSRSHWLVKTH
jgi:hypothetical protein